MSNEVETRSTPDGKLLPLDSLAHVYTYNADGTVATDTVTFGTASYRQSYTYSGGNLTNVSTWVKQ